MLQVVYNTIYSQGEGGNITYTDAPAPASGAITHSGLLFTCTSCVLHDMLVNKVNAGLQFLA